MPATFIRVRCPHCGRGLKPLPFYTAAVTFQKRRCPKCESEWRVKVTPLPQSKVDGMHLHQLDWMPFAGPCKYAQIDREARATKREGE